MKGNFKISYDAKVLRQNDYEQVAWTVDVGTSFLVQHLSVIPAGILDQYHAFLSKSLLHSFKAGRVSQAG